MPEDLVSACNDLGIPAMALLDRDGVYGAPRFHMAAKMTGMRAHIGSEITCTNGKRYPLAMRKPRGLPEPVPPGHAHEIARKKRRRRRHAGRDRGVRAGADLHHAGYRRDAGRHFRHCGISMPNCSGIWTATKKPATRLSSKRRAGWAFRWWLPMAFATPSRGSGKCWTCSPACAKR